MSRWITALAAAVVLSVCAATASAQDTKAADKGKPAATAKMSQPAKTASAAKTAGKAQKTAAADPQAVAKGEKIFADQKCSICHSIAGKGRGTALDTVGSDLIEEDIRQWLLSPKVMAEKKKSTKKPLMPQYTKLTADELNSLVAYLKSLKKK